MVEPGVSGLVAQPEVIRPEGVADVHLDRRLTAGSLRAVRLAGSANVARDQ